MVIPPLDEQGAAVLVSNDAGHADRVAIWSCSHLMIPLSRLRRPDGGHAGAAASALEQ